MILLMLNIEKHMQEKIKKNNNNKEDRYCKIDQFSA